MNKLLGNFNDTDIRNERKSVTFRKDIIAHNSLTH